MRLDFLVSAAAIAGLACAVQSSNAAVIMYEGFDYAAGISPDTDGGINGGQGLPATNPGGTPVGTGTGFRNNAWDGVVAASGLTYPGLATNGRSLTATISNQFNTSVYRNMTSDPWSSLRAGGAVNGNFGVDGTTLYLSFLMSTSSVGTTNDRALLMLTGNAGTQRAQFGIAQGGTVFSITSQTGSVVANTGVAVNPGDTYFLVAKMDFAAGNDTFSLWVNPTPGGTLGTPDATTSGFDLTSGFNQVGFRYNTNTMNFDELRIGQTYADVAPTADVPEPAALSIALVGAALALRRRK